MVTMEGFVVGGAVKERAAQRPDNPRGAEPLGTAAQSAAVNPRSQWRARFASTRLALLQQQWATATRATDSEYLYNSTLIGQSADKPADVRSHRRRR
jgi:hypothetical protein